MKIDYGTIYYSLPGLSVLITAECVALAREHRFGKVKNDIFASVCIGVVAIFISAVVKGFVLFFYSWMYQFRLYTFPTGAWWVCLIGFFGDDLSYYWFHRTSHHVRFLWASHSVHHSPQIFTLSSALRLPWTSHFTGNFLFWAWMPLIGISPAIIVTMKSISTVYQLWLHTEKIGKLPKWIEAFFNTPSHHRVHHGSDTDYLDKNHAGTLIIWDRMFGTYAEETHRPVYGLTKNINSHNPIVIAFYEWANLVHDLRKAKTGKERLNFIFNSPGWSSDGESKTTRQLRGGIR